MADTYIQLPTDAANTGKKVRTNDRSVGGNTVHEHYHIIQDETNDTQARVLAADPSSSDGGLVVRSMLPVAPGSIATGQVSVTTSSAQIIAARTSRRGVTIVNHGTTDVFVGPSGVSTTTGILLPGVKGASLTMECTGAIHAVVASGTQTISYLEQYA